MTPIVTNEEDYIYDVDKAKKKRQVEGAATQSKYIPRIILDSKDGSVNDSQ